MISSLRLSIFLRLEIIHMDYDMKECGKRIQQLRLRHGYTQDELARELHVNRSLLSYVESGKKGLSVDLLVQLSVLLDASLDYIILGKLPADTLLIEHELHLKANIEMLISQLEDFKSKL